MSIESQLVITRLAPRSVALLQLHPAQAADIAPLVAGAGVQPDASEESATVARVFAVGPGHGAMLGSGAVHP